MAKTLPTEKCLPLLRLQKIHKQFPGVYALKDVSFDLFPGEVHGLMGENGAGKSTLIKIIAGVYDYQQGEYQMTGQAAKISGPLDAINKGISVIYQELNSVPSLSVAENIYFGRLPVAKGGRVLWKELYQNTERVLAEVGLAISAKMKVQYLSVAQQQLVEIAKALSTDARVIVMDEPTSALSPKEVDNLFALIRKLKEKGVGIVYVSHKLEEVLAITDRVTVLRDGEYIGTEDTANLNEEQLITMMVGRKLSDMFHKKQIAIGATLLEVEGLTTSKIHDISFSVRKGEIVGFSGLMGAGRTELARAIFGADRRIKGEILLGGQSFVANSTVAARQAGIGLVPESRKDDGVFPNLCVKKNTTIASTVQLGTYGRINGKEEKRLVNEMIQNLAIKTPSLNQLIMKLSGGNQQKVIVARWLMKKDLKLLIIDEPTRGIDVGAKAEIYSLLGELAGQGMAIIMMSSEMPELLGVCDRIFVMKGGRITAAYDRNEASQEKLLASAIM